MILITGLTGTSGSAFYDVLCREKFDEKIRVVVRKTSNIEMFNDSPLNIELVEGNIDDIDFLVEAMKGCNKVFHIAAKAKSNYIAEAVLKSPSVKFVIFVSSTIVYSKFYSNSTLNEIEPKIKKDFKDRGIKYVFIRPTMIFGTLNDHNISVFIRWFKKYPAFPIVKHGQANIQPVSRLDVAEAYYLILKNIEILKQDEYVVSGKEEMTLLEMFKIITELLEHKVVFFNIPFNFAKFCVVILYFVSFKKIDYREKLDRLGEDRAYAHEEIEKELGYNPKSFRERVKPLIDEIKNK